MSCAYNGVMGGGDILYIVDHPIEDCSTTPKHTRWSKVCDLTEHPIEETHLDQNTLHSL